MYCSACGKEIADGSAFCPYCGYKIVSETAQTPQPVTDQAADTAATEPVSYGVQQTAPVQPDADPVYAPNNAPQSSFPQQSYVPQETVSQQGYGQSAYQGYEEPAKNIKEFAQRFCEKKDVNSIKVSYIILYVCAGINAVIGLINKNPYCLFDVFLLGGLGLWLQLTYSKVPAIIATAYGVFSMLFYLIAFHQLGGWLILAAGIGAVVTLIPFHKKYNLYKNGMYNTQNNYGVPQQGYGYAPAQNYGTPVNPQAPAQNYGMPVNPPAPEQNNYAQNGAQPPQQDYYNR